MRSRKYRLVTTLERGSNRLICLALCAGFAPHAFAMLETTGRRTGLPRQTPVGNGLAGDTFWLVAAHGKQADYVRNLQAEPRVRVKAGGVWRSGTAVLLPGDDPAARSNAAGPMGRGDRQGDGFDAADDPHRPRPGSPAAGSWLAD